MFTSQQLKLNPLDLADCDLVFGPVVKFGGPGRARVGEANDFRQWRREDYTGNQEITTYCDCRGAHVGMRLQMALNP